MKNLALASLLTISFSSLFAQKQTHDETLVFGNDPEQLAYGELYLNNASHDTLKNVVFYYFIKSIRDSKEVRTVDTAARIITSYNFADITGFHVGRAIKIPHRSDTGRFYSVTRKGINTLEDGKRDIAQAFLSSPKFMLLSSVRLPWTEGPYYYRLANMPEFAQVPLFGEQRFGPSFKKQFAKIFEGCPAMQQMVKDKNYIEDVTGLIEAFRDYNGLNCPDNVAAAN